MKLFWNSVMDYSYLFVTRNFGVGERRQTSERVIKITELNSETDTRIQKIYIFEKDDRRNPQGKEETFCVRQLLNNLEKNM